MCVCVGHTHTTFWRSYIKIIQTSISHTHTGLCVCVGHTHTSCCGIYSHTHTGLVCVWGTHTQVVACVCVWDTHTQVVVEFISTRLCVCVGNSVWILYLALLFQISGPYFVFVFSTCSQFLLFLANFPHFHNMCGKGSVMVI